jgi:hypothetical protein
MKTHHITLNDTIKVKHVRIELEPQSNEDASLLNSPLNNPQLDDHFIFYLQGKFPNYSATKMIDTKNYPRTVVMELVRTTGI